MQQAVRSSDLIRQLLVALVHRVEVPHILEVLDDVLELRPDLIQLLHRVYQAVLYYFYHLKVGVDLNE